MKVECEKEIFSISPEKTPFVSFGKDRKPKCCTEGCKREGKARYGLCFACYNWLCFEEGPPPT